MNWDDLENNEETKAVWSHFARLGKFRSAHPAVGAGVHHKMQDAPYTFHRVLVRDDYRDEVVVSMDNPNGEVSVVGVFKDGETLYDHYSGQKATVADGKVKIDNSQNLILLGRAD